MRILLRFFPAVGASAIVAFVIAARQLSIVPRATALIALLGAWASPLLIERLDRRAHVSVLTAIAAVIAAGQTIAGPAYGVAAGLFLVGCLAWMRRMRSPLPSGVAAAPLPRRATLLLVVVAAPTIAAGLAVLPPVAAYVERRVTAFAFASFEEETAFSTAMILGATRGMLQNDTVVLRIDGEPPAYLRGAVYDRYNGRFWTTAPVGRARKIVAADAEPRPDDTVITLVRGTPNGDDMRWFVPNGACDVATAPGQVELDGYGVYRRGTAPEPRTFRYRTKGCRTSAATTAPPAAEDLDVYDRLLPVLAPLATRWTEGATTDREKLDALTRELARFEYSLAVERDPELDPIVDFLTVHRAGHCEMFASALALLARTKGIPTRVVGGYRVSEHNRLTGKTIVRERNAHAWTEAWVDGAWRRWDATPAAESLPRSGATEQLADAAAALWERAVLAAEDLELWQVLVGLGVAIAVLSGVREGARRLARRRARGSGSDARPFPAFVTLTDALEAAGHPRDESEPLEAFARRLRTLDAPWASAVADALVAYAAHRYGGAGDAAEIAATLERARAATSGRS